MKKLKFTELLVNPTPYEYNLQPIVNRKAPIQFEQEHTKPQTLSPTKPRPKMEKKLKFDNTEYIPVEIIEWEKDLEFYLNILDKKSNKTPDLDEYHFDLDLKLLFNDLLKEKWEDKINQPPDHIILNYQDPNLIFSPVEKKKKKKIKYNMSNDKYYIKKTKKEENLMVLGVQHSIIALKLNSLFYKTHLTKEELRHYHRPKIDLRNLHLRFEKKNKIEHSFIKKIEELTIDDGCNFCLIEYCEEYPLYVNNTGMVSLIQEFRREGKVDIDTAVKGKTIEHEMEREATKEKLVEMENFNIVHLKTSDPSPFPIGDVKQGQNLLAITNNLFKAPIYKHSIKYFIVSFNRNKQFFSFIKPITAIYTVGQTLPLQEVYAPHSKALNIYCKNRLKMSAFTLHNKIIKMKDLDAMFPLFSEGSKRKWLKEYAEKRKDNTYVLNYRSDEISVIPENVCQYESMLVGDRLLKDGVMDANLTPWNLSRNFLTNKIEIEGKGDPTGEGISFSKGFRENSKELIAKRWDIQEKSLTKRVTIKDLKKDEINELQSLFQKDKVIEELPLKKDEDKVLKRGIKIIRIINGITEEETIEDKDIIKEYLHERKKIKKEEKKVHLKCGNCGQVGHMKTNKLCPKYVEDLRPNKKQKETYKRKMKAFLCDIIINVLNKLCKLPSSIVFQKPVNVKKFTTYLSVVNKPIDLSAMKSKARQHKYYRYCEFLEDLELMRDNCIKFNGKEHSFSKLADEMYKIGSEMGDEKRIEIENVENILNNE